MNSHSPCLPLGSLLALFVHSAIAFVNPAWDFVEHNAGTYCVNVTQTTNGTNTTANARLVFAAFPSGTPPAGGWPIYFSFVTDSFSNLSSAGHLLPDQACAGASSSYHHSVKNYSAFATPKDSARSCFLPHAVSKGEDTGQPEHDSNCGYEQQAGGVWDQRLKQLLLANGVAVVQVNPLSHDMWQYGTSLWSKGDDHRFLSRVLADVVAGVFGPLDASRMVLRGWSVGAQMVSWMFEVLARDPRTFGVPLGVRGGIILSGGSYQCYNDPDSDAGASHAPVASCMNCTRGGPSHCAGDDPLCTSCTEGVATYCQQCCPRNYTEQFYFEGGAAAYASHPPTFLAQMSTEDSHADLCAARHYHNTLVSHGVRSELVLVPEAEESCFCVGNPREPASAGSPFAYRCGLADWGKNCSLFGGKDCCITHTMAFASMLEPALNFTLDVLA